jgi:GMP synthase (glutamine-hydrolysing)
VPRLLRNLAARCAAGKILALNPKGVIFSGGPSSVYEVEAPQCADGLFHSGIPILGICYGHQLMAHMMGGRVTPADKKSSVKPSWLCSRTRRFTKA